MIVRPMPDVAGSNLIYYDAHNRTSVQKWTNILDQAFEQYRKPSDDHMMCSHDIKPYNKLVCAVPVDDYHPCTSANLYNYENARPCVFFELDKVLNWQPVPYNSTKDLPQDMPEDLQQHINVMGRYVNAMWLSCDGVSPVDRENIGPIQYIPRRGFPTYYFPFTHKEGYLNPLVAVLFEKPRCGVVIGIECRIWARNIAYDGSEQKGHVRFELLVDN